MRKTWLHRLVERLLPWYDPAVEAKRDARSNAIHKEAIEARITTEETIRRVEDGVRRDYAAMDERLKGR